MASHARVDVAVVGGGVAGLWTLALALRRGLSAALFERSTLGDGQTIASQGILHAGVKYALPGEAAREARALGEAARVWEACLAGDGEIDLRNVRTLSTCTHLWTAPEVGARLAARGAAALFRSSVRRLGRNELPSAFADSPQGVEVYEAEERVIEPSGLIHALAEFCKGRLCRVDESRLEPEAPDSWACVVRFGQEEVRVQAASVVLAAGAGNASLLAAVPGGEESMQRRPLHQVMVEGAPVPLFGHCVGLSGVPRLTVTSAMSRGRTVWYLGGGVAESGVECSSDAQIERARAETAACLPWIDVGTARWATLRIDRAEGRVAGRKRPESFIVRRFGNVSAVWPTKLALAPLVAAEVAHSWGEPRSDTDLAALASRPGPRIACPPWEREGVEWR
ncbi:MAG TPA: FAD-dependent oxidoreductase [Phycisphaerales bacterium]|nr:FAD-dependent oxidoreductase [Phycisphaerales bacterium]